MHENTIERGNPCNRDPMDPTWTYKGSRLKELLDEDLKCPPRYCSHGTCTEGSELTLTLRRGNGGRSIIFRTREITSCGPFSYTYTLARLSISL